MTEQFYERDLAPVEIHTRTELALLLMGEQDDLLSAIAEKRREIRALNVIRKKLESRVGQLRREIRSGKALEPRQTDLPLLAPEPEIDKFAQLYPMARTHAALRDYLADALTPALYGKLAEGAVEAWHVDSGIFFAVANWARIEKAHRDAGGREPIAGLLIPRRTPRPEKLSELLQGTPKKKKKKRSRKP